MAFVQICNALNPSYVTTTVPAKAFEQAKPNSVQHLGDFVTSIFL